MRFTVLTALINHGLSSSFIPLDMKGGAPHISIDVTGAVNNPQILLFDTGSPHTYVLSHRMLGNLPRARNNPHQVLRGIQGSLIRQTSLTHADASHVNFAQFSGLKLVQWARRRFKIGSLEWSQKFAVAHLPQSELGNSDPEDNGLIGATPCSHFTQQNPQYGFFPVSRASNYLFLSPINTSWCRDSRVEFVDISDPLHWTIAGRLSLDSTFVLAESIEFLIDSGTGIINLPERFHDVYRGHLSSRNIPSLDWSHNYPRIASKHTNLIPPFVLSFSSGISVSRPPEAFVECKAGWGSVCVIYVGRKKVNQDWITFGEPLFQSLITEFDSRNKRIGFCEPIKSSGRTLGPHLITDLSPEGRPQPWVPRRVRMRGDYDQNHSHYRLPEDLVEDDDMWKSAKVIHVYYFIPLLAIINN